MPSDEASDATFWATPCQPSIYLALFASQSSSPQGCRYRTCQYSLDRLLLSGSYLYVHVNTSKTGIRYSSRLVLFNPIELRLQRWRASADNPLRVPDQCLNCHAFAGALGDEILPVGGLNIAIDLRENTFNPSRYRGIKEFRDLCCVGDDRRLPEPCSQRCLGLIPYRRRRGGKAACCQAEKEGNSHQHLQSRVSIGPSDDGHK